MIPFYFSFYFPQIILSIITYVLPFGFSLLGLAFCVIYFICKWKVFQKAGQKGWVALIPIYSIYVFIVKICGIHWAFFILLLLGFINPYTSIASIFILTMCFYNLAKRFNRNRVLASLSSILFAPLIIVAYGLLKECVYNSKIKVSNCGYFNQI